MPTLSTAGKKIKDYLDIWKKSGKDYLATKPHIAPKGKKFSTGVSNATAYELSTPVLTIGAVTDSTVGLSWGAITNGTTYTVVRATNKQFTTGVTQIYNSSGTSMTASALTSGVNYYFKVTVSGSGYGSAPSAPKVAKTATSLPASTSLVVSGVTSSAITWTWAAVSGATGYTLERATNAGFSAGLTTVYTGALLTFQNTGLTTATTYYYRLRATNATSINAPYITASQLTA